MDLILNNRFYARLVDVDKDWVQLCDNDFETASYKYWTMTPAKLSSGYMPIQYNDRVYTITDNGDIDSGYIGFDGSNKKGGLTSNYTGYGVRPVIEFYNNVFDESEIGDEYGISGKIFYIFGTNKMILSDILPIYSCYSKIDTNYETSDVKRVVDQFIEQLYGNNLQEGYTPAVQEFRKIKDNLVELFNQNGWTKLLYNVNMPFGVMIRPICHRGIIPKCELDCAEFLLLKDNGDGTYSNINNTGGRTLDRIAKLIFDIQNIADNNPIEEMITLRGVTYSGVRGENVQENISNCRLGEAVKLTRVAGNLRHYQNQGAGVDETAVEVRTIDGDLALGFIPTERNERIARKLMQHKPYKAYVADISGGMINRKTGKPYSYGITIYVEFLE